MVHEAADVPAGPANLDSVRIAFDEQRLVSDAGLLVTATLAQRLGLEELVNESVSLGEVPGAARPGRKVMSLVHGMLAGADRIDQMNVLRAGSTGLARASGHGPLDAGDVLAGVHVRARPPTRPCLDVVLTRAWATSAGPGDGPLVIDIDSFVREVYGDEKDGASYGYTHVQSSGITRSSPRGRIPARCCTSAAGPGKRTRSAV